MLKTIPERIAAIDPPARTVTAEQAAKECETNHGIVIDVREPAEHMVNPAPGAINFPRGVLEMKMLETVKDPTTPIYLHCASSARAKLAAEQLRLIGYENISVMTCDVPTIQKHFAR